MALQISAFKGIRYDRWKGEKKLFDPTWLLVDDKISNICQEFSKCDESQRNSLRNLISDDINNTLVTYSLRMSIFAMRQSNLEFIRNSFIALAMINSKIYDYRDWHVLSVPIYVSYKIGGDTDKFLKEAIKLTDNYAVERMQMEIGRNRGLQLFDEIETENGMGLIGKWHGKINSSYDLKRTAFEITKMIESDKKYLADDIDSADKLPKIWLSGVDDAQLEKILMGTRAGIQVSATLLPNIHPSHTYQVLWVQIYEFPNVEDVKVLFAISQKVKAVGYNMFAIKYDRLFCVVISRCVAQNCIAYETQGSIQRYKHKLIEIVKKYASTTSSNAP